MAVVSKVLFSAFMRSDEQEGHEAGGWESLFRLIMLQVQSGGVKRDEGNHPLYPCNDKEQPHSRPCEL